MKRKNSILSTAISVALTLPAISAAEVDTSEWACQYCPFEAGYRAEIDAGAAYVSDDAARFGNGTGLDEKGAYVDLGGNGRYVKDGTVVSWYAEDLGTKSRVLDISAGKPGKYEVSLGYRELPYRLFDTTDTVFASSGAGVLTLPSDWVTAGTTAGFTALNASLVPVNIEKDRQIIEFGGKYLPTRKVKLYADYSRQQRDGVNVMAGARFTQSAFLPRPIDDYTDQINAGMRFSLGPVNLGLAYFGSFYRNKLDSLTWDNPYTAAPGAEQGRLALEPDNDFQQFSLSGIYRAATYNTVVAFSTAFGRGTQNAAFLPYTLNPTLPVVTLPSASLDGQVDTGNYALTITSHPLKRASIKFAYRYDERDNQTPVSQWTRVITDTFPGGATEANVPYSFERSRLNLSGSYRLLDSVNVSAGYDRTEFDRDYQEVANQTEDTGWGKLRWRPNSYIEASLRGGASRREIDRYNTDIAIIYGQNPLMRKYNLAYRYREFAEMSVSASLPETPVSLGVTYLWAEDSYSKSSLGIIDGEENRVNVDLSWAVSEAASVYLSAGSEQIDANQVGSEAFAGPEWQAAHEDEFTHYGGGFRVAGLSEKVDLTLDYTRSDGETAIQFSGQNVSPIPLPDLESTMDSLRLSLNYNMSERMDWNLGVRYERFETADWALDGVEPDTIPVVLTMGANSYDYDVWVIGIGVRYRIGPEKPAKQ
jgi:MtrB/PioB family decaheme-associated outer membrane protein